MAFTVLNPGNAYHEAYFGALRRTPWPRPSRTQAARAVALQVIQQNQDHARATLDPLAPERHEVRRAA